MSSIDQSDSSLQIEGRYPFLTLFMNAGLISASALAGWIWTTVISTGGQGVWFSIVCFCGVLLGIAVHQLITKGRWCLTFLCLVAFAGSAGTAHSQGASKKAPQTRKTRELRKVMARLLEPHHP